VLQMLGERLAQGDVVVDDQDSGHVVSTRQANLNEMRLYCDSGDTGVAAGPHTPKAFSGFEAGAAIAVFTACR